MINKSPSNPEVFDPIALSRDKARLQGSFQAEDLQRLAAAVGSDGQVAFDLRFDQNEDGNAYCHGKMRLNLHLMCQRCMQPFEYNDEISLEALFVASEGAAQVFYNQPQEIWITSGKSVQLTHFIEEEALLALPMIPKHPVEECPVKQTYSLD